MAKEKAIQEDQAPKATKVVAKKGTQETEKIVGLAAGAMDKALKELSTVNHQLSSLFTKSEEQVLQIAQQEAKIAELEAGYAEKLRAGEAELQAELLENRGKVVSEYLAKQGLETVVSVEYKALKEAYEALKKNFDAEVTKGVSAGVAIKTANFETEKKLYIATQEKAEADNKAKVANLEDKVVFLEEQVETLHEQLKTAGENTVKVAQAGAVGTINLGGTMK